NFKEMKKVVLSLAVLFSVAMVSCGGNKNAEVADSDSVVVEEVAVEEVAVDSVAADSAAVDTVVAAAAAVAAE
ncbi:MAG: hypothetical protein K2F94_09530, partial [Muribaculaceae bacterium]|nr:hypothetical protein [Muribaculaceae bacterium]